MTAQSSAVTPWPGWLSGRSTPHLQDRPLQRSSAPEIDQLESELGDMISDGNEKRVSRHRQRGKKMWGNSPTSTVGP